MSLSHPPSLLVITPRSSNFSTPYTRICMSTWSAQHHTYSLFSSWLSFWEKDLVTKGDGRRRICSWDRKLVAEALWKTVGPGFELHRWFFFSCRLSLSSDFRRSPIDLMTSWSKIFDLRTYMLHHNPFDCDFTGVIFQICPCGFSAVPVCFCTHALFLCSHWSLLDYIVTPRPYSHSNTILGKYGQMTMGVESIDFCHTKWWDTSQITALDRITAWCHGG